MKVQACKFSRIYKTYWESGVAIVKEFGQHDVKTIIDSTGKPVPHNQLKDYEFTDVPLR